MMKKLLILSLVVLLTLTGCAYGSGGTSSHDPISSFNSGSGIEASKPSGAYVIENPEWVFEYKEVTGGISITRYTGENTRVVFPEELDGKSVVAIGGGTGRGLVFEKLSADLGLIVSFAGQITEVEIPDSVAIIDNYAFSGCSALKEITLPKNIWKIGVNAFMDCKLLTRITIPAGVTTIGAGAFAGCEWLAEVILPDSLTAIGRTAFTNCQALKNIKIPAGVKEIDNQTFTNCFELTSVSLPAGLTKIGDQAFANCHALTDVTLPDTLRVLGQLAFENCRSLTRLAIPEHLSYMGARVFRGCDSLDKATWKSITYSVVVIDEYYNPVGVLVEVYDMPSPFYLNFQ